MRCVVTHDADKQDSQVTNSLEIRCKNRQTCIAYVGLAVTDTCRNEPSTKMKGRLNRRTIGETAVAPSLFTQQEFHKII